MAAIAKQTSTGQEPALHFGSHRFNLMDIAPPFGPPNRREAIILRCETRLAELERKKELTPGETIELNLLLRLKYTEKEKT